MHVSVRGNGWTVNHADCDETQVKTEISGEKSTCLRYVLCHCGTSWVHDNCWSVSAFESWTSTEFQSWEILPGVQSTCSKNVIYSWKTQLVNDRNLNNFGKINTGTGSVRRSRQHCHRKVLHFSPALWSWMVENDCVTSLTRRARPEISYNYR
jgi:hypothetical protein